jgi:threonine aldolase
VGEVATLAEWAHARGLRLHLDGARLANAAAHLDVELGAFGAGAGVDVLSFGGTKNGAMGAEAVVVFEPASETNLPFIRKQSMQLASKMRFLAAQFDALLEGELWLRCAGNANAMAVRLSGALGGVAGLTISRPVETNAVFATLPPAVTESLQRDFPFYTWDETVGEVRWMCSWDTTEEDVDTFAAAVRDTLA